MLLQIFCSTHAAGPYPPLEDIVLDVQPDVGFEDEYFENNMSNTIDNTTKPSTATLVQDVQLATEFVPLAVLPDPTDPDPRNGQTDAPSLDSFATALFIWERQHGISRQAHEELIEVLWMVTDMQQIRDLPKTKDTLQARFNKGLPRVDM
jgi:hypothetical protein